MTATPTNTLAPVAPAPFVPLAPWRGIGVDVASKHSADAIVEAKLDWNVESVSVSSLKDDSGNNFNSDIFLTYRTDNRRTLGAVTDRYKIVQNSEAFSFLDSLVDDGNLEYETCGTLQGGRTVWMLGRIPLVDEVADGDAMKRYILFANSHDGSAAIRCFPTSVRVVCQNTLNLALRQGRGEGVTIHHKGDINIKLNNARTMLAESNKMFAEYNARFQKLAQHKIDTTWLNNYLGQVFPVPSKEGKALTGRNNIVAAVKSLYHESPLNNFGDIKGTAWAALNSVTEYVDHHGRTHITDGRGEKESRFNGVIFGSGANKKNIAVDVALAMVG